jgi:hypothetical protein
VCDRKAASQPGDGIDDGRAKGEKKQLHHRFVFIFYISSIFHSPGLAIHHPSQVVVVGGFSGS